jgi:hypothetical protein
MTVRSDLYYHCSNPSNPSCRLSNSGIELVGVGGATASGRVEISSGRQTSHFTLQGVDKLTVVSTGTCIGWSVEGKTRGVTCP